MSHPPMRWDALNGFWPTEEEVERRRTLRERTLLETRGRVDIFATSASMALPWQVSASTEAASDA